MTNDELAEQEWRKFKKEMGKDEHTLPSVYFKAGFRAAFELFAVDIVPPGDVKPGHVWDIGPGPHTSVRRRNWETG